MSLGVPTFERSSQTDEFKHGLLDTVAERGAAKFSVGQAKSIWGSDWMVELSKFVFAENQLHLSFRVSGVRGSDVLNSLENDDELIVGRI